MRQQKFSKLSLSYQKLSYQKPIETVKKGPAFYKMLSKAGNAARTKRLKDQGWRKVKRRSLTKAKRTKALKGLLPKDFNVFWFRFLEETLIVDLQSCLVYSTAGSGREKYDDYAEGDFSSWQEPLLNIDQWEKLAGYTAKPAPCQPRELSIKTNRRGYKFFNISRTIRINRIPVRFSHKVFVHRAMWMARYRRCLKPHEHIDHKDGDKENNHWRNLKLVTMSENNDRRDLRRKWGKYKELPPEQQPGYDPWAASA